MSRPYSPRFSAQEAADARRALTDGTIAPDGGRLSDLLQLAAVTPTDDVRAWDGLTEALMVAFHGGETAAASYRRETAYARRKYGKTRAAKGNPAQATPASPNARDARALLRLMELGRVVWLGDVMDAKCLTDEAAGTRWTRRMVKIGALEELPKGGWRVRAPSGCLPPPAPRAAASSAAPTLGERGRWKRAPRGPFVALGPVCDVWDGAGRRYLAQWVIVRADAPVVASHTPAGVRVESYPQELQARDRDGALSRLQVDALAQALDPIRLIAPSSSVVDSAPVIVQWGEGLWPIVSGNGRRAALQKRAASDPAFAGTLAEACAARWRLPDGVADAVRAGAWPARLVDVPRELARELAGASQTIDTGAQTRAEASKGRARAGALSMATLPTIHAFNDLTDDARVSAFEVSNPAFTAAVLDTVPKQVRFSMPARDRADLYRGIMFASLPSQWPESARGGMSEAWWGALPGLWTLAGAVRDGRRDAAYDLIPHVPAAIVAAERLRSVPVGKLGAEVGAGARQVAMVGAPEASTVAGLLASLIVRASRRDDPADAVADALERYYAEAPDPSQPALGGFLAPVPPEGILSAVAGVRVNPEPCMCDLATRWHWGKFKRARTIQRERLPWQPARGFALGRLVGLRIGGEDFEVPEGADVLLCATGEGRAELFTSPPIQAPAEGPIQAIRYVAQKGNDAEPMRYEHETRAPHPRALAKGRGRALQISTRGARMWLSPERGLVD